MPESMTCQLVLFERWPHPSGPDLVSQYPLVNPTTLQFSMPDAKLREAMANAHIYQVRSTRAELPEQYWVTDSLFENFPNLLAVSTNGSGYDTVDLDACTRAGVLAVNQAGGNKQAVAEHALGMMLVLSKKIVQADRAMRTLSSLHRETFMGNNLFGKTLGIVGLGQIGSHVARLASGLLGMRVLAFDPFISAQMFESRNAECVDFAALLAQSDFISVHCPRNSDSERMFDAQAFAQMKPAAYFVTTARGGIHDEHALAAALADGQLAGAGLDVWDQEPPSPDHPLLQMDNVIASPHTAGVTHESRADVVRIMIEQINTIAQGERPPRLLNPQAWPVFQERYRAVFNR